MVELFVELETGCGGRLIDDSCSIPQENRKNVKNRGSRCFIKIFPLVIKNFLEGGSHNGGVGVDSVQC